jgi:transcriptional regulator with XRE-family HTH domain
MPACDGPRARARTTWGGDFASSLRAVRERSTLTKSEFARSLGVTPSAITRWEQGEREARGVRRARLIEVARSLGMPDPPPQKPNPQPERRPASSPG